MKNILDVLQDLRDDLEERIVAQKEAHEVADKAGVENAFRALAELEER